MLKAGDLVCLRICLERKKIGMVLRCNLRYSSYTIYWVATGETCAKCIHDVVKIC